MVCENLKSRMIKEQLMQRGINDARVLDAFRKVSRHEFVPEKDKKNAYNDHPISIGEGQTISQPYIVALMTQSLELTGGEKVLEIGTGSGYQTAILAELCDQVYSIERIKILAERAVQILGNLHYKNIHLKIDDGTLGWKEQEPFNAIIVTAGSPEIPKPLIDQLANNAKMVIPVGSNYSQVLKITEKKQGKIMEKNICGCVFVPLLGKHGWN